MFGIVWYTYIYIYKVYMIYIYLYGKNCDSSFDPNSCYIN